MQNDIAIKVTNLSKSYKLYDKPLDRLKESLNPFRRKYHKEFYALNDISFEIKRGETIGIIGKNGSGKSTLLKIITGVVTPTSGNIEVNGKISALLELGAGFNPEFTGMENIYMNGTIMGFTREEMEQRVNSIVEFADIGDFIYQPVKMYSSGMFARLAFSVSVNVEPDILIVDEALSVGDAFFQQKCINKMKKMQEKGTTIFFVSHSLSTVKSLCGKAIYLCNGDLISIGNTDEICTLYQNELTSSKKISKTELDINLNRIEEENSRYIKPVKNKMNFFRVDNNLVKRITERSGGGELKLTAFDIYDESDNIVNDIAMFQKFWIRASFEVNEDLREGAYIGILCRNKLGIDIFACNSNAYSMYLPKLEKNKKFVFEIEFKLPLIHGEYFFSIGVKPSVSNEYFYDRCFTVGYLIINKRSINEDILGGIIYVKPVRMEMYID
jgi:ABC-type polysaccharide/polyol phosphate transport system ATPase subunit